MTQLKFLFLFTNNTASFQIKHYVFLIFLIFGDMFVSVPV